MSVRLSHLRITASAGTGKTFRLTDRIVELLLLGVEPRKILALTFTRKAAGEFLRKLLEKLAQGAEKNGEAKTFFERRRDSAKDSGLEDLAKHYAAEAKRPEAEQQAEFRKVLRKVTEDLDRLEMGTLDSFLFRLVKGFAPELGLNREVKVLDEAAEEREEAEVLGELATALGSDAEVRDQLCRDLVGGEKGAAPADPLRAEVRELQEAERIWHEEPGAVWGGERELFPKGQPPAALIQEPAWTGLPAGWVDFPEVVREVAAARAGTKLSGKAGKLLENIAGLEAGRAEFTFNRKSGVLQGEMARYAGAVARGYVKKLVDWRLGRTRRQGEYAQRLTEVRERRRARAGMLRFADLPRIARDEVIQVPVLAYRLDGWFDHWLLDEFQDTSRSQWSALEPLVQEVWQDSEGRRTIFYVGDVKQAIYGWRGGDAGLFTDIAKGYEGRLKDEQLDRSYRSGEKVLQAVEDVFQPEALRADGVDEKVVQGWELGWTRHRFHEPNQGKGHVEIRPAEGEEIWTTVAELVKKSGVLEKGGTVGVLTRTNDLAHEGAELLSQEELRVTVEGKRSVVAEGPLGPACLLAARLAADPSDRLAAGGLAAGMLVKAVVEGAERFAFRSLADFGNGGAEEMVRGWLGVVEIGGDPFLEDLAEALVRAGRAFDRSGGASVREFHRFLAEYQDPGATLRGAVQLMTMHKAKGLEFNLAIVVLERGWGRSLKLDATKGPHLRSGETPAGRWVMELPSQEVCDAVPELAVEMERVRREAMLANLSLHYVAMTRARQALVLVLPPVKDPKDRGVKRGRRNPMAKREGVEIDGLFRRGLATPLGYLNPGWERELGSGKKSMPQKCRSARLKAEMPGVMRVLPSGLGKHRMTGRSIFGQAGGLGLGEEVHRLLEGVEWGGLDPAWKAESSPEAWNLADRFCRSAAGQEVFEKREGCRVWREKALEVLDEGNRLVAAAVDRAVLEEKKGGQLRIYDFKTDQITEDREWLERHGPQLRKYAELLGGWWQKQGGGGVKVWIAAVRSERLIEVPGK